MSIAYPTPCVDPIRLVVLDLAGTTVDYGSRAPLAAFLELFRRHGVELAEEEARGPMGTHKRKHIEALLALPRVHQLWCDRHGNEPGPTDVQQLYEEFQPIQLALLSQSEYANLIPGAKKAASELRALGCRIGVTTGYSWDMTDVVLREAARRGFAPDVAVSGSDVPEGRPAPWLAQTCARELGIYPMTSVVKAGDTVVDVEAGLNAGMWSLGIAATGNLMGLSQEAEQTLAPVERAQRLAAARQRLHAAGAHAVLDSIAELPAWVEAHNQRAAEQA